MQLIHYAYVHQVVTADILNVLPAGLVAIAVLLVFADLHAAPIFRCAAYGEETEIQVAHLTHITLPLNQHTLAVECEFHKITVVAVLAILWFALHLSQVVVVVLLTLLKAHVSVAHGAQAD